ncbi:hypothetical protein M404DRAFT_532095 [Pisolithus tinctorius Marx 270]|uniref:Uncharacterized protein n=1 Tax=Pisolithus tinctorius Marx 270 TaxID=870435 RepID=A0A0C3K601_PISTI|nr:hypothetical protein M404DRAFT_532095 [Pisolithus tinctorius Marx 270]
MVLYNAVAVGMPCHVSLSKCRPCVIEAPRHVFTTDRIFVGPLSEYLAIHIFPAHSPVRPWGLVLQGRTFILGLDSTEPESRVAYRTLQFF